MNRYQKIVAVIAFGALETFLVMGFYALPVRAETRVNGLILNDTVWTRAASPYLLTSNVTVLDGAQLTIEAGASVGIAPEADTGDIGYAPGIFVVGGQISLRGDRDARIAVKGVSGIFVASGQAHNGSADISRAYLSGGSRLAFENSIATVSTSTIEGSDMGIYFKDSIVSVQGSRIRNNDIGVYVQPHSIFLSGESASGMGGIGNALDEAPDLYASSSLSISGSSISGSASRAISNGADLTVQARNDWWGSASGPAATGADSVQGKADYSPWLSVEPAFDPMPVGPASCCSSVLFIPGLEATRMYRSERNPNGPLLGTSTIANQLWEPMTNADAFKLRLNASGSSTDPAIYSGMPIDKALGVADIYSKFTGFLDGLVSRGIVGEWQAFGYDWRKPVDQVVLGAEKKATTTQSLVQTVMDLAARSKTGKVSIVAHSNGGLVAKYLVKALTDMGKSGVIDSVVSVAVPYLGTPQAIAGLLHGDDQAIFKGLILSASNARSLGANMPSAYSLLPSRAYFSNAFMPTIAFASTSTQGINNGAYPQKIASFDAERAFIADSANVRKAPAESNTKMPIKGNRTLLAVADVIHSILDPFQWPATIARWAIIGWNSTTTSGVLYSDKGHTLAKNIYGDGTVIAQSASYEAGQAISMDLAKASSVDGASISHSNILESSGVQSLLGTILKGFKPVATGGPNSVRVIPGASWGNKDWNALSAEYDASRRELRISTHSPVKLHVYDAHGNHTGEIPLPVEILSQTEEGLYSMKEEKIPGSTYEILGCETDDDCDTEITLPDGGETYTAVVDGVGTGSFTLDIDRIRGASTTESVEWKDVPTTELTVASTTISGLGTISPLSIDIDGDGTLDATSTRNTRFDSRRILELLRKFKWPKAVHGRFRRITDADRPRILAEIAAFMGRHGR